MCCNPGESGSGLSARHFTQSHKWLLANVMRAVSRLLLNVKKAGTIDEQ